MGEDKKRRGRMVRREKKEDRGRREMREKGEEKRGHSHNLLTGQSVSPLYLYTESSTAIIPAILTELRA